MTFIRHSWPLDLARILARTVPGFPISQSLSSAKRKSCDRLHARVQRPKRRSSHRSEYAKKWRLKIQYGNDIAMSIYTRSMLRFGDDSVKACWSHLETKRSFSIASGSKVLERQLFDFLCANFQDGHIRS